MAPRGQGARSHVKLMTSFSSRDCPGRHADHNQVYEQRYFSKPIHGSDRKRSLRAQTETDKLTLQKGRRRRDQRRLEEQRKQLPRRPTRRKMKNKPPARETEKELETIKEPYQLWKMLAKRAVKDEREMDIVGKDREEKKRPAREGEKELETIKEQYELGKTLEKRVVKDSLGSVQLGQPLFGRGSSIVALRAGIDKAEQTNPKLDDEREFRNENSPEPLFVRGSRILALRLGEICKYKELEKPTPINEMELKPKLQQKDGEEERTQYKTMKFSQEEATNFYGRQVEKISNMTNRDWQIYIEDLDIFYKGSRISCKKQNQEEFGAIGMEFNTIVRSIIQKAIAQYKRPSPIQIAASVSLLGYNNEISLSLLKHIFKYTLLSFCQSRLSPKSRYTIPQVCIRLARIGQ